MNAVLERPSLGVETMDLDELFRQLQDISIKVGRIEERQLAHKGETDAIKASVSELVQWKYEIHGGNKRLLSLIAAAAGFGGIVGAILTWFNGAPK